MCLFASQNVSFYFFFQVCLSYEFVAMSLENDANGNEGEKLDPETTENVSLDETGSSSSLVDLHACGICFQVSLFSFSLCVVYLLVQQAGNGTELLVFRRCEFNFSFFREQISSPFWRIGYLLMISAIFQPYNDSERLPKVLSCGHTNCLACLNSWVKHGSSVFPVCAVCRRITHKPVYLLPNNFQLLGHNMALRTVEHSVAAFLQQWQSTRRCLRFTNNPVSSNILNVLNSFSLTIWDCMVYAGSHSNASTVSSWLFLEFT
ncbi:unnamed protein product [Angiostrongylus costaricensis]|uniref:RING-type domain-containing protein n=1 Tax=Angiostrongylus costaricensis TaxID=334426 RepID=A0A0R3Q1Q0_ANGCS|nr:unnamed protein product [Angiostrongylus costaricensis]